MPLNVLHIFSNFQNKNRTYCHTSFEANSIADLSRDVLLNDEVTYISKSLVLSMLVYLRMYESNDIEYENHNMYLFDLAFIQCKTVVEWSYVAIPMTL